MSIARTPLGILCGLGLGLAALAKAPAQVGISEFMAANSATLADEDGAFSDWIEIHNAGTSDVELGGWYLTDQAGFDVGDPDSYWRFPPRTLAAGAYLVVFASGKNRGPAAPGELHTSFRLDAAGERLALVMPDGVTVATEFTPVFPPQRTDVSFGPGAVVERLDLVTEGAAGRVLVPQDDSAGSWTGGAEPFDDAAWTGVVTGIGFDVASGPSGFTLVDDFEGADPGALNGQGGWSASSDRVIVTSDPVAAENQVLEQSDDSVRAWKDIDIPDGTTATLYFRMRRDGIVNIAGGASDKSAPNTNFSEFETQLNNQNDDLLKMRDGGQFVDVDDFDEDVWYEVWMVIDNAADHYRVYLRGGSHPERVLVDAPDGRTEFAFRNGTSDNPMRTVLMRTGSGTSGAWYVDDIYLAEGENLASPSGRFTYDSFIAPGGDIAAQMSGVGAGAYLRVPFTTGETDGIQSLVLRMRYDDGFVAYLNGTEIARRNAPEGPGFDAVATAEHAAGDAIVYEEIDVTAHAGTLLGNAGNVLAVHGLNLGPADGDFLLVPELVATRPAVAGQELFFTAPTPGAANGGGVLGFVADTKFDIHRGFFSAPFTVQVSCGTPGATVIYTTDGSTPGPDNGTRSPSPATVAISTTTPLRAAAFKDGFLATNVDTHTYIFVEDVAAQGAAPPGYPATWKGDGGNGSYPADYEMDPEVTGDPAYSGVIDDALLAIPTISLVTDRGHLFDPATGIYQNPQQSGDAWERPVSVEILHPGAARPDHQVDAGIRIQGGHTRLPSKNPKHSFRLTFRTVYGAPKLDYDLFPEDPTAAREFDQLVLRGAGNQSWLHHNEFLGDNRGRAQYIRDQWAKDTQLAMGHPGTRNLYAHLYINGLYWGLYNPTERATDGFGASYLGGAKEDFVALNSGEPVDGDTALAEYNALLALAERGLADPANYAAMAALLDLESFSDYIILNHYGGNLDWDDHNWYAIRNTAGGKWHFIAWDNEFCFIEPDDSVIGVNRSGKPSRLWNRLMENGDYRLYFADRVHFHCANGGLLTEAAVVGRWEARRDQMFDAIVAESARWGDYRRDVHPRGQPTPIPLYDRDGEWQVERDRLLGSYFPVRTGNLIAQYRSAGRYPGLDAPVCSPHGGRVPAGYPVTLAAPGGGEIRFTTDGSDPRDPGAGVYDGTPVVIDASVELRARAWDGAEWSPVTLATFHVGTAATAGKLAISEIMYNPEGADDAEFVELINTSADELDLGGVHFTEGIEFEFPLGTVLAPGATILVVRDLAAFGAAYGSGLNVAGVFAGGTVLDNDGERLTLNALDGSVITSLRYNDQDPWPPFTDGEGHSLVWIGPAGGADPGLSASWRPSTAPGGNPDAVDHRPFTGVAGTDADGDGNDALLEHALGCSDQIAGDSAGVISAAFDAAGVILTYQQDLAADDVEMLVETSTDLAAWEPAGTAATVVSRTMMEGGTMRVAVAITPPPGPSFFLRLKVSLR